MINFILNTTVPRQKLNMGLAFYGHSYNLSDPTDAQIGSPIDGSGNGGETLKDPGVLAYYEVEHVCEGWGWGGVECVRVHVFWKEEGGGGVKYC